METVVGAIVGGCLAIVAGLVATHVARRASREHRSWELQVGLSRDALAALQRVVRALLDIAYLDLSDAATGVSDGGFERLPLGPGFVSVHTRLEYDGAITSWNAARYAVLVGMDDEAARLALELDQELDRLIDAALSRSFERSEFRMERRRLGELMAAFVEHARVTAGLPRSAGTRSGAGQEDLVAS